MLIELFFGLRCKQKIKFHTHKCSSLCTVIPSKRASYVKETMDIFVVGFWILTVVCIALFVLTHKSTGVSSTTDTNFRAFQRLYLIVFLLAMGNMLSKSTVYCNTVLCCFFVFRGFGAPTETPLISSSTKCTIKCTESMHFISRFYFCSSVYHISNN